MDEHVVWSDLGSDVLHGLNTCVWQVLVVLEDTFGLIFILDIANSLLSALSVYEDLGKDAKSFSRKHPFACWLSVAVNFFAGGILANFLLGEPILAFLNDPIQLRNIYVLTFAWWFVFHAPFNFGYKLVHCFTVKLILSAMKEIYRSYKIHSGVSQVGKLFNYELYNHLLMVVIGTVKGNGAAFMMFIERLIRGSWIPKTELLQPSFTTKISLVASFIFVLNVKTDIIALPDSKLSFIIAMVFVFCKLVSMLRGTFDPFIPVERMFCNVFLGGIGNSPEVVEQKKKNE